MGIITISRQIGAGETTIAPAVAQRLGWELIDDKILDSQAEAGGIQVPYLAQYDERVPGRVEAWTHPHDAQRYFETLRKTVQEFADRGNVVIVGRGGNFLLQHADALHVRLTADMDFRIRRVMEVRWITADGARDVIARTDHDRRAFCRHYFQGDWDDPLAYGVVLNMSRIGIDAAVDTIVAAARFRWPEIPATAGAATMASTATMTAKTKTMESQGSLQIEGAAKIARVYIGDSDQWHGRALANAIVERARAAGMAGATVVTGIEGFGGHSRIRSENPLALSSDRPVMIEIIDIPERIDRFLPVLDEMVADGLITVGDGTAMRRIANPPGASA